MIFKNYTDHYYQAVCDFLIELNRDNKNHINWNWARFEWMAEHPEFDKSAKSSIGLWLDGEKVVGAAIYDMYFGEAFCGVLPEYADLYPAVLEYAYNELKDENGLGIALCDDCKSEIEAAKAQGFILAEQDETVMSISLNGDFPVHLPHELHFAELDPVKEPYDFQWLLWQGFDHGTDKEEFEREDRIIPQNRKHLDPYLSIAAVDESGERVAYCCLWYSEKTDYAYVEPLCVIPSYRAKGVAKAIVYEALSRARSLGAKKAYVLSDMKFYQRLGFEKEKHFSFYFKQ